MANLQHPLGLIPTMQCQINGPLAPYGQLGVKNAHVGSFKIDQINPVMQFLSWLSILFTGNKQKVEELDQKEYIELTYRIRISDSIWVYLTIVNDYAVVILHGTQDPVYLHLCRAVMNPMYNEFIQLNHDSPKLHIGSLSEHNPDLATHLDILIL